MSDPLRLLHFADVHIDIANYGRHDPETGLPLRIMDFLQSLDTLIDTAIQEKVDLVLFAGDTYKDRNPHPTFQREWGMRMMRLSKAKIPTLLLVGNHDVSPAIGRSHTLQEFNTFNIPFIFVADQVKLWTSTALGLPIQVISVPWISRSHLMSKIPRNTSDMLFALEKELNQQVETLLDKIDPSLPVIILAHVSVQGAQYSSERTVMLGQDLILSKKLLTDPRIDYVALGHIHKHQSLNGDSHPPIIYPGSIERINFGEIADEKGFVLASIQKGKTEWNFRVLPTRRFFDFKIEIQSQDHFMEEILNQLPPPEALEDAICRVQLKYPREWESLLDESRLEKHFERALKMQIQKHRHFRERVRLEIAPTNALNYEALLQAYWKLLDLEKEEQHALQTLAKELFSEMEF